VRGKSNTTGGLSKVGREGSEWDSDGPLRVSCRGGSRTGGHLEFWVHLQQRAEGVLKGISTKIQRSIIKKRRGKKKKVLGKGEGKKRGKRGAPGDWGGGVWKGKKQCEKNRWGKDASEIGRVKKPKPVIREDPMVEPARGPRMSSPSIGKGWEDSGPKKICREGRGEDQQGT